MTEQEIRKQARENLNGSCKVCRMCNGVAAQKIANSTLAKAQ